jgi:carbamoyl-phosphate synthase large subunit
VPFVSKAIGRPLAKIAARVMAGATLQEMGFTEEVRPPMVSVKKVVLPFRKMRGSDPILGPEMKSTGEVMGAAATFGEAFAKATMAASERMPIAGTVFLSVNDADKAQLAELAKWLRRLRFHLLATQGTAKVIQRLGVPCDVVYKVDEGRPNVVEHIRAGEVDLIINTPLGRASHYDERAIRMVALDFNIPCLTTMAAARAMVLGIVALSDHDFTVRCLQDWHRPE